MKRNKILNNNPPGSFSYFGESIASSRQMQRRNDEYDDQNRKHQKNVNDAYPSPVRVTREEIENMSDEELAYFIRQQEVQVDRIVGGGLIISRSPQMLEDQTRQSKIGLQRQYPKWNQDRNGDCGQSLQQPNVYPNHQTPTLEETKKIELHRSSPNTEKKLEHRRFFNGDQDSDHAVVNEQKSSMYPSSPSTINVHVSSNETNLKRQPLSTLKKEFISSSSTTTTFNKKSPSLDIKEITQLRSQLAQSLGREDYLKDQIKSLKMNNSSNSNSNSNINSNSNSNSTRNMDSENSKAFQHAVVECIEELNQELNMISNDILSDDNSEYDTKYNDSEQYNSTLSYIDQLILHSKRYNSPSKHFERKAILSTLQKKETETSACGNILPLSRGIRPLSGYTTTLENFVTKSDIKIQPTPTTSLLPPPPPPPPPRQQNSSSISSLFQFRSALGMDENGNITICNK